MASDFLALLSRDFGNILESRDYVDLSIKSGKESDVKLFEAHSLVVCARCPYFKSVLEKNINMNKKSSYFVKLENISPDTFEPLLKYIYTGCLPISKHSAEELLSLLLAAKELGLKDLVSYFQTRLVTHHSPYLLRNIISINKLATANSDLFTVLNDYCKKIIDSQPSILFRSSEFTTLDEGMLVALLQRDDLQIPESSVFDYVFTWGLARHPGMDEDPGAWSAENVESLRNTLKESIPLIRWFHIPSCDFVDRVKIFERLLPEELYYDLLRYYMVPNYEPTFIVLPPRNRSSQVVQILKQIVSEDCARRNGRKSIVANESNKGKSTSHNELGSVSEKSKSQVSSKITRGFYRLSDSEEESITSPLTRIYIEHDCLKSVLLTRAQLNWLASIIQPNSPSTLTFTLLLRGTRDGFSSETFHSLCTKVGPTITVARVALSNELVGGYNPLNWVSTLGFDYAETDSSFLFGLRGQQETGLVSRVTDTSTAIRYHKNYGPIFGGGHDLVMLNNTEVSMWSCKKYSYANRIRAGEGCFVIDEYEVFAVQIK